MTCNGPDRIYAQYRNKPKAVQWYEVTRNIAGELCIAFEDIEDSYNIDTAQGDELDTIGRIVVIDRSTVEGIDFTTYEFGDDTAECGDEEIQFAAESVIADAELSDEYFKTLIKVKIAKNNSDSTIDGILDSLVIIAPEGAPFVLNDFEDMSFTIDVYGDLTDVQRELIINKDILPKPQGVRFGGFFEAVEVFEFNSEGLYEFGDDEIECAAFVEIV